MKKSLAALIVLLLLVLLSLLLLLFLALSLLLTIRWPSAPSTGRPLALSNCPAPACGGAPKLGEALARQASASDSQPPPPSLSSGKFHISRLRHLAGTTFATKLSGSLARLSESSNLNHCFLSFSLAQRWPRPRMAKKKVRRRSGRKLALLECRRHPNHPTRPLQSGRLPREGTQHR